MAVENRGKVSMAIQDLQKGEDWKTVVENNQLSSQSVWRLRSRLKKTGSNLLQETYSPRSRNIEIANRLRDSLDPEESQELAELLSDRFCIRSSSGDNPLFLSLGRIARSVGMTIPHREKIELVKAMKEKGLPVRIVKQVATYPSGRQVLQRYFLVPSQFVNKTIAFL